MCKTKNSLQIIDKRGIRSVGEMSSWPEETDFQLHYTLNARSKDMARSIIKTKIISSIMNSVKAEYRG